MGDCGQNTRGRENGAMAGPVDRFVETLMEAAPKGGVFNPWNEVDEEHDKDDRGPVIRRAQLAHYLECRLNSAAFLLIGEAVGYQGGHFSGIPMTSERMLLGYHKDRGILPEKVLPDLKPRRTSAPKLKAQGFTEPTATIVWQAILDVDRDPREVVLWNAFPWHPYDPQKGRLSNRRPTAQEMEGGIRVLQQFLKLFPDAEPVAVGRVAEDCLDKLGIRTRSVRHPAQGGAKAFRASIRKLLAA
jgi:hypothetical protein